MGSGVSSELSEVDLSTALCEKGNLLKDERIGCRWQHVRRDDGEVKAFETDAIDTRHIIVAIIIKSKVGRQRILIGMQIDCQPTLNSQLSILNPEPSTRTNT